MALNARISPVIAFGALAFLIYEGGCSSDGSTRDPWGADGGNPIAFGPDGSIPSDNGSAALPDGAVLLSDGGAPRPTPVQDAAANPSQLPMPLLPDGQVISAPEAGPAGPPPVVGDGQAPALLPEAGPVGPPPPPGPPGCGLRNAAFCDTFDTASPGGNAGDLDDANWSVTRISTNNNTGQGQYNQWQSTTMEACGKSTAGILPDNDMLFCAGGGTASMHLNNSYDDAGGFTVQSYRVRRPFDFANRTGIIAFDVGGKATVPGGHGFWFNIFLSAEPVPAPYQEGGAMELYAKAGIGIEFEASPAPCGTDQKHNGVSNFFLEKDYQITSKYHPNDSTVTCFTTEEEVLNHIEIHISDSKIEVFASDAGQPQSMMRSVASADTMSAPNLFPLPFTRAYVNFQHTHYNSRKFTWTDPNCDQVCCAWETINDPSCVCHLPGDPGGEDKSPFPCVNTTTSAMPHCPQQCPTLPGWATYHWDNIGFDGPAYPTPRAYEVPDGKSVWHNNPGTVNLGYILRTDGLSTDGFKADPPVALTNVDLTGATDAVLTMNAWNFCTKLTQVTDTLGYRFNGGMWRMVPHYFPDCTESARAVAIPVQLSDLKSGANTFEMKSTDGQMIVSAVELTVNTQ